MTKPIGKNSTPITQRGVDFIRVIPYNSTVNIHGKMSVTTKFKKEIETLRLAATGEIYLDVKNPKLYKKVVRYYQNEGYEFSGEPLDDYEILLDCLVRDLEGVEVA
jgi:hypothetical protein